METLKSVWKKTQSAATQNAAVVHVLLTVLLLLLLLPVLQQQQREGGPGEGLHEGVVVEGVEVVHAHVRHVHEVGGPADHARVQGTVGAVRRLRLPARGGDTAEQHRPHTQHHGHHASHLIWKITRRDITFR